MKTKYFFLAAAAALFAACSSDDGIAEQQQQVQQQAEQVPVAFDYYVGRGTTRAGLTGNLNVETIKTSGFGVFGYYTNADSYDQTFTPNFMYNQHVTYGSSKWEYSPVKYWPNEFGANASSEDVDKVSFFAYAPYVTVNATSGKVTKNATYTGDNAGEATMGIVGMTRNTAVGDPMVKYISTFYTDEQVDLTWGTVPGTDADLEWEKKATGNQKIAFGKPWLNVEHPSATSTNWNSAQKVKFNFQHALASLNVQVDTKANSTTAQTVGDPTTTKVFIRSVTFEGFDTKGALNLNNTSAGEALWYNFNCEDELNNGAEITIKDGRKDGKEGVTAATSENALINPDFVQSAVWGTGLTAGVTGDPANLFRLKTSTATGTDPDNFVPEATAPIYVIPNDDALKVTIEYDVLTADNNLAGKLNDGATPGSVVKNVITRYITKGAGTHGSVSEPTGDDLLKLKNGNKYTIKLHLGLNSVEFDMDVKPWADPVVGEADLPHNN